MTGERDFERAWLAKFSSCLDQIVGQEIREAVIEGSEELSSRSDRQAVVAWSRQAMERLDALVDEKRRKAIMVGCACQYPKSDLQAMRQAYEATGDVGLAHQMLQEQFESFLRNALELSDELVREVVSRGWGAAGVRRGNTIVATKIPKSGYLVEYLRETDPEKKRQLYCHCPRIRDVLKTSETISATYCYCGAGFYEGIWREILQKPVKVEVLESVLKGDPVCTIAIHLPLD
jgi:predicted ArsR family transcriptional regulator